MCDTSLTPEEIKEQARKARRRASSKRWREKNLEKLKAYRKDYVRANKEEMAAKAKVYREKNRGRRAAYDKAWRIENRTQKKATYKAWATDNPQKLNERRAKYRVKLRSNPLNNSTHRLRKFLKDQKVPCHYCSAEWDESFHVDHFLPISAGAPEATWNLRSSCQSCNLSKGARMPWDFMQQSNLNYYDEQNCTGKTETSKEKETQTNEKEIRAGYTSPSLECRERADECNCNCSTNESRSAGD